MKLIDKILGKFGYSKKMLQPQEDYTAQIAFCNLYEPTKAYASVNFPCTARELEEHAKELGKTMDEYVRYTVALKFLEYISDCLEYELAENRGAEMTQATATLMVWRREKE